MYSNCYTLSLGSRELGCGPLPPFFKGVGPKLLNFNQGASPTLSRGLG